MPPANRFTAAIKPWYSLYIILSLGFLAFACGKGRHGSTSIKDESRGTAIFFEWLDDRFVVATDSLEIREGKPVTLDDCKIVVQGSKNNFFTVSGGIRSGTITNKKDHRLLLDWDTQRTAARAYQTVAGTKDPQKVAAEWRRITLIQLNSLPLETRLVLGAIKNNQMLFVGLLPDGNIDGRVAAFSFNGRTFDITIVKPVMNKVRSIAEGEQQAGVFMTHSSPEAKQEAARWQASLKSTFGVRTKEDFQTELVIETVDWVIKHPYTVNGVAMIGGQVEAIKLTPNSTATWLRPCPATKGR